MNVAIVDGMYSVKDAAAVIGVTDRSLRRWINNYYHRCPTGRGKPRNDECKAAKVEDDIFAAGFVWQVPPEEVDRLRMVDIDGNPGRPRIGHNGNGHQN